MASKRKGGRPTKFNEHKAQRILSILSEGNYLSDAAALAGVDVRTVQHWIQRGKDGEKLYRQFAADVAEARAQFTLLTLRKIMNGEDVDRGKRWVLERTRPRQFGEKVQVEVEGALDEFLKRLKGALEPDIYERVIELALAAPTAGGTSEATGG